MKAPHARRQLDICAQLPDGSHRQACSPPGAAQGAWGRHGARRGETRTGAEFTPPRNFHGVASIRRACSPSSDRESLAHSSSTMSSKWGSRTRAKWSVELMFPGGLRLRLAAAHDGGDQAVRALPGPLKIKGCGVAQRRARDGSTSACRWDDRPAASDRIGRQPRIASAGGARNVLSSSLPPPAPPPSLTGAAVNL